MPNTPTSGLEQAAAALAAHRDFLVTSHVNPDGDSLGAQLACARLLEALGKRPCVVNQNPAPPAYSFLPDVRRIALCRQHPDCRFTAAVVLDIGEWERLGEAAALIDRGHHLVINIDHHESNHGFGQAVWVEPQSCATSILIYRLYRRLGVRVDPDTATQLYTGILTDTGGFRFANTNPEALSVCADLVACGADPAAIMYRVYFEKTALTVQVLGRVLTTLEFHANSRIAALCLDRETIAGLAPHSPEEIYASTDGIIDYARAIRGVEIAILFREEPDGVKVSLRANSAHLNMNLFAARYGGGGHPQAAGGHLPLPLATAKATVLQAAIDLVNHHGSPVDTRGV